MVKESEEMHHETAAINTVFTSLPHAAVHRLQYGDKCAAATPAGPPPITRTSTLYLTLKSLVYFIYIMYMVLHFICVVVLGLPLWLR